MHKLFRTIFSLFLLTSLLTPIASSQAAIAQRSLVDRPDDLTGFQVHVVYVVPADKSDLNADTNGTIANTVADAQSWLQRQIGHQLIFDTYKGEVDISFMKSKYKESELCLEMCEALSKLSAEFLAQDTNYRPGKTYYFQVEGLLAPNYCGWAGRPANSALGFSVADGCNNPYSGLRIGLSVPAKTLVHELFHTFGVAHTCINESDLMIGTPECTQSQLNSLQAVTLDLERKNYIGGDASGVDLLKMPIWKDGTGSLDYAQLKTVNGDKYLSKIGSGYVYVMAGQKSTQFVWEWDKNLVKSDLDFSCSITSQNRVETGTALKNACYFQIPSSWRAGQEFEVFQEFHTGPFWGKATVTGTIARKNYSLEKCTSSTCYVGQEFSIEATCWTKIDNLALQEIIDGKWVTIANKKTYQTSKCGGNNMTADHTLTFTSPGVHYYRWNFLGSKSFGAWADVPFALIVDADASVPEASDELIAAENKKAISLGKAADEAAKAPQSSTITCTKGKLTKKITGVKPSCPAGYKKKAS